jgi:hypothetical protein
MVFTVNPAIARQQTYRKNLLANVLGAQPGLGTNPYAQPNFNFLGQLGQGYLAGQAGAEAQRLENEQKAAQAAMSRVLFGGTVPAATAPAAPQPTGFLSRAKQAIFPSVPTVSQSMGKYAGATAITPEMSVDAGADPLQMELSKRTIAAQDLTISQQKALRTVRTLQNKKAAAGALTPDEQKTYDAALQNLPADVSALNTLDVKKDAEGNVIGHQIIDIFGNPVSMKYAPASATSINLAGPKAEREAVGKGRGKTLEKLEFAADDATQNLAIIEQALDLYARGEIAGKSNFTGTGVETILNFKSAIAGIGNAFGFDPEELGIDIDKISDQQTLRSALNQMVLKRTQLIKGALSDRELLFSAEATANFGNTPTANQMILLFQKRAGIRAQELAELANEYFDTFGTFGGTKGEKFHGKEYKSFRQFQNEYKNQDAIIGVGMIGEINSVPQLSAYIKLRGGTKRLTQDESMAILGRREQLTR